MINFTKRQLECWAEYEEVRQSGVYNMFDPNARLQTSLSRDEWIFTIKNYTELKQAQPPQKPA